MGKLPNEAKERARIAETLPDQFTYSHRLLDEFLQLIEIPIEFHTGFPPIVIDMAMGLHVRISQKIPASVVARGGWASRHGRVICRSMFEAFLAQSFVCRSDVTLTRENGGVVDTSWVHSNARISTVLYYAHVHSWREEDREHGKAPGTERGR